MQGLNILLSLVRNKLVAVILGPAGMGLNTIYNEARELIHASTNMGLDVSGVKGISQAYENYKQAQGTPDEQAAMLSVERQVRLLRSWVLLLSLLGALVCAVLSLPLSWLTFKDLDHVWGYVLLAPSVAFSTITCGEMAVLKGLRRLRSLAAVSLLNVLLALVTTVPVYYVWGIRGVLPALLLFTLSSMLMTLAYGWRSHRLSYVFDWAELKTCKSMLSIGITFVISQAMGHAVFLGIQSFLNNTASLEMVGLFNAGYTLTMTYAGIVFAAMDSDFFPRLSGVIHNDSERNDTVMKQLEVNILLLIPLLMLLIIALPYLVPLLLDQKFAAIIPMTQITAVGLLFRAIVIPNAYLPLAAGDTKVFFVVNLIGALDMLVVIPGYMYGGLFGAGIALTAQNAFDMLVALAVSRFYYHTRFSNKMILGTIAGTILLVATFYLVQPN